MERPGGRGAHHHKRPRDKKQKFHSKGQSQNISTKKQHSKTKKQDNDTPELSVTEIKGAKLSVSDSFDNNFGGAKNSQSNN